MKTIFIDSDVILDYFFDRKPFSNDSLKIFQLCEQNKVKAFVTPVIVSNIYYLLRKVSSDSVVREHIKKLLLLVSILDIPKNTILKAIDSNFKDFEDALQNYASEFHSEIETIVTRNIKDFKESKLSVMTPKEFLIHTKE